jgi:hypothetical protein
MLTTSVRRLVPLVLALLAAVPQAAFAGQWYRCRYTGETRSSCCCGEPSEQDERTPTVARADCCDLLRTLPTAMTARPEAGRAELAPLAPVGLAAALPQLGLQAPGLTRAPLARATAPPPRAAPLYLRNASLLL